jgi:hypothetical protein
MIRREAVPIRVDFHRGGGLCEAFDNNTQRD